MSTPASSSLVPGAPLVSGALVPGAALPALTGVRFVAAFAVVLCHFGTHLFAWGPEWLVRLFASMFNAVGFFFMLSGFILAHTYGKRFLAGGTTLGRFYRARWARLYPAYVVALVIAFPEFFVTTAGRSWGRVAEWSAVKLAMLQAWLPGQAFVTGWNPPTWSISTEIFFYLVFPFAVGPVLRLGARRAGVLFAVGTVAMSLVALLADYTLLPKLGANSAFQDFLIVSPLPRLFDFVLGIATYRIATEWSARGGVSVPLRRGLWIGVGVALVALLATNLLVAKSQGLTYPLFGIALVLLALGGGRVAGWLGSRPLVRLGEESYALYLVHFPVGAILMRVWTRAGYPIEVSRVGSFTFGLVTIAVSLALARVIHRFVEDPGRRLLLGERRPRVPVAG